VKILVVDVGGTHIKVLATGQKQPIKIESGPTMTPRIMVQRVLAATKDWKFEAVSIGYPGAVVHGKPMSEPHNLGAGWVGFNFKKAFGCPVRENGPAPGFPIWPVSRCRLMMLLFFQTPTVLWLAPML